MALSIYLRLSPRAPYGAQQCSHYLPKSAVWRSKRIPKGILTRAHDKKLLVVYQPKTEKAKSCLTYKRSIAWNMLDINIQSSATYNNTKKLALENVTI